jgi:hypothetical protein
LDTKQETPMVVCLEEAAMGFWKWMKGIMNSPVLESGWGWDSAVGKKKCPFCAEWIKREAKVCKECHKEQPPLEELPRQLGGKKD